MSTPAPSMRRAAHSPVVATSVVEVGDALTRDWGDATYDVVLGNPPYLSQLAAATSRGGASRRGGGPYADAAAEFLVLAVGLARPGGGRVGLVLPQSILGFRDAGPVRAEVEQLAEPIWSWWSPRPALRRLGVRLRRRLRSRRARRELRTRRAATANPCGPAWSRGRWACPDTPVARRRWIASATTRRSPPTSATSTTAWSRPSAITRPDRGSSPAGRSIPTAAAGASGR